MLQSELLLYPNLVNQRHYFLGGSFGHPEQFPNRAADVWAAIQRLSGTQERIESEGHDILGGTQEGNQTIVFWFSSMFSQFPAKPVHILALSPNN